MSNEEELQKIIDRWKPFFENCGIDTEKCEILPPMPVDYFVCASHPEDRTVMIVFQSGEVASGILLPVEAISDLRKRLKKHAQSASRRDS